MEGCAESIEIKVKEMLISLVPVRYPIFNSLLTCVFYLFAC